MTEKSRWLLLFPAVCLLAGGWFIRRSENLARIQFERARQEWRLQHFNQAVDAFEEIAAEFPATSYAPRALWEVASISYFNLDRSDRATGAYLKIVAFYPRDPLATESRLKLAELFEREFGDLEQARLQWEAALEGNLDGERRRRVALKVADCFLHSSQLAEAELRLRELLDIDDEVAQEARLRIGTILQIRREYAESVPLFRRVLVGPDCGQCRLQARLSLIESYELLDELSSAIREARRIDPAGYPAELKRALLARLLEKQQSFRPRLWNAD